MADPDAERWCAMALPAAGRPLQTLWRQGLPVPAAGQLRIRVAACGVCRTERYLVDGDLPLPGQPVVSDHEIVGRVSAVGSSVTTLERPYCWLGGERRIVSAVNLTRRDGDEFRRVAASLPLRVAVHRFALSEANMALDDLRAGRLGSAAVLACRSADPAP